MNNLPAEILHGIFIHLPMIQKQECMLVCHQWKQLISTRSLYRNITCNNTTACNKFIDMVEKTPSLATQVEYLELSGAFGGDYDKISLLKTFPKLCEIKIHVKLSESTEIRKISKERFTSLPNQIESIEEGGAGEMTCALSASGLCSHLVTLNLNLLYVYSSYEADFIFNHMKNMPVLETLKLSGGFLKLLHCETIHTNIPSLHSLSLYHVGYDDEEAFPTNIQPATSVTKLTVDVDSFLVENQNKWFRYICIKYPQLQKFRFANSYSYCTDNMLAQYYQVNLPMLIQNFGSQLTSLNLVNELVDASIFAKLDEHGCRIKKLNLWRITRSTLDALSQSNQCKYIEKLLLRLKDTCGIEWLKSMKNLKSLSLGSLSRILTFNSNNLGSIEKNDITINMMTFFQYCPETLESIEMVYEYMSFDMDQIQIFPGVKKLSLLCKKNPQKIDIFISQCLPRLECLTIGKCFNDNESLMFPNHHFTYLDLLFHARNAYCIELTTLNDNTIRHYNPSDSQARKGQLEFDDYIAPTPESSHDNKTCLKVTCGSVKDLVVEDLHAHLISNKLY